MKELLEEILEALAGLLQSGFATAPPLASEHFDELARRCEDTGLHTGAALLREVSAQLSRRRHAAEKQDQPLADAVCRAARYTALCIGRADETEITARWETLRARQEETK